MKIILHKIDLWPSLGFRIWMDNHSMGCTIHLDPLLNLDIEIYYRKNFWVKRGLFINLFILSCIEVTSDPKPGEKIDDEPIIC